MTFSTLSAFGLYLVGVILIGLFSYHKSKNSTDFIIGDRSLNFYVTALSAHASDMSSWLFMAYPALLFSFGGIKMWVGIGLVVGFFLNWLMVAPRLRAETGRFGSLTISGYFATRFGDYRGVLRAIGAIMSLLFFTVYVAAGLVGIGFVFDSVFKVDPLLGITIGIAVVILYTMVGGFVSVCWVDLFQALFLVVVIAFVPFYAAAKIGGFGVVSRAVSDAGLSSSPIPSGGWGVLGQILLSSLGWGLGYFGQTHILNKFMAIKRPEELRRSMWLGMSWQTVCLGAATLIGLVGIAYFPDGLANPELVFVKMVRELFHPFVGSLILCAILAATISTVDSQILVLVSVTTDDLYHRFFHRDPTARETLWSSRISVVVVAIAAYLVALLSGQGVLSLVFYSWSGLGSTFGPVLILALYSKTVNWYGALFGMVFGGLVAAFWPVIEGLLPIEIPALIPGFLGNMGLIWLVSKLTGGEHEARLAGQ